MIHPPTPGRSGGCLNKEFTQPKCMKAMNIPLQLFVSRWAMVVCYFMSVLLPASPSSAQAYGSLPIQKRGPQVKAGPPSVVLLTDSDYAEQDLLNLTWRIRFLKAQTNATGTPWSRSHVPALGSQPPPKPIFCPIFVNHKYRMIYLKAPKTAGSSLLRHFGNCHNAYAEPNFKPKDSCLQPVDLGSHNTREQLAKIWSTYYVFMFARNVYQRAVSQYLYLTRFMKGRADNCTEITWEAYCANPMSLGEQCHRNWQCCHHADSHQYMHSLPQATCMLTADGKLTMDYIGDSAHFQEDLRNVTRRINAHARAAGLNVTAIPDPPVLRENRRDKSACTNAAGAAVSSRPAGGAARGLRGVGLPAVREAVQEGQAVQAVQEAEQAVQHGGRRRLSWIWKVASYAPHYCNVSDYFTQHPTCARDLAVFFGDDVRVLHGLEPRP